MGDEVSGHPSVPINEVTHIIGGGTPPRSNPQYYGGDIPWVTPKDMKGREVWSSKIKITQEGVKNSTTRIAPKKSVLVVVRSGVLKHTIPVGVNQIPVAINQDLKALVCAESINPEYLAYFIKHRSREILRWVRATTADNFPISNLEKLKVPLLPIKSQENIVRRLDATASLQEKRRRSIKLLDELTQSIFLDMFGDITRQGKWDFGSVSDLVARFESGKSLASASDETKSKYRILKISAVTSGFFKPQESKGAPVDYTPPASHFVRGGDLLFSRANTSELIGATALVDSPQDNLVLPDKLWRFVWHDELKADPVYINHMFSQAPFRDAIRANSTGSSGSMKNISQKKVLSIPCALPPLSLQKEFADKARRIQELRKKHQTHLSHLDELFASVQQRAFDGTLWDDRDTTA